MEQPMRCKTLTAIYKNEINTLKKLYEIDFLIHKSVRIHIEQFTVRKIEIDFTSEQLVDDLIAVLTKVERLLMLFDGYFMNLISIEFQDSAGCVPPNLKECAEHFMRRRLAYPYSFHQKGQTICVFDRKAKRLCHTGKSRFDCDNKSQSI